KLARDTRDLEEKQAKVKADFLRDWRGACHRQRQEPFSSRVRNNYFDGAVRIRHRGSAPQSSPHPGETSSRPRSPRFPPSSANQSRSRRISTPPDRSLVLV